MSHTKLIISNTRVIVGGVPPNFKASSGKENFMSSLNTWLVETVLGGQLDENLALQPGNDFYWKFDSPLAPNVMPSVGVSEIGLFNLGQRAMDDNLVGFTDDGKPIRAVRNQTLVEINCWHKDSDDFGGAGKKVRELRDRIVYGLEFAGTLNDKEDAFIIPPIKLCDFSKIDKPVVGVIYLDPSGNSINEKFLIDPITNQLKRYKLLVRFLYDEYKNPL